MGKLFKLRQHITKFSLLKELSLELVTWVYSTLQHYTPDDLKRMVRIFEWFKNYSDDEILDTVSIVIKARKSGGVGRLVTPEEFESYARTLRISQAPYPRKNK